ncbi:MAG TPA: serine/threonine-protein kinase [Kofleriaceae bacterium]|nr:serine/threonine-protein kinase [Kofleriaceae bacterium]
MTSDATIDLGPNSLVGSYRLVKEIGRGGMGVVYQAEHIVLPRRAAIKVMHATLRRLPGMATRMVQEAAILERLRHPGVVKVHECNLLPDLRPWIAMELVAGETLAGRLANAATLSPLDVARLLVDVADVLAAVHARGVVHRDLKPDNLILTPGDAGYPLRVIDWGVARLGPIGRITLDGMTPGTPIYMSPEQAAGHHIAAPCDIYSLGVIAYEALAGHPPFDGRTLAEVVCMHVTSEAAPLADKTCAPIALCGLVHHMLDKDPSLRPSALEVRQLAQAVIYELSDVYESLEISGVVARPRTSSEILEFGVTELVPTRRPRWTPEIAAVPAALVEPPARLRPITPKGLRDQVSGEIVAGPRAGARS